MHLKSIIAASFALGLSYAQTCSEQDPNARCIASIKSPKPSKKYCGARGEVSKPKVLGKPTFADCQESCRDLCLGRPHCIAFGWDEDDGGCTFYGKTLQNMNFKKKATSTVQTWNRDCYDYDCCYKSENRCNGDCTNLSYDNQNCGVCGYQCPADQNCKDRRCTCANGATDVTSDNNNCGSCGRTCADGATCSNGRCVCGESDISCEFGTCSDGQCTCADNKLHFNMNAVGGSIDGYSMSTMYAIPENNVYVYEESAFASPFSLDEDGVMLDLPSQRPAMSLRGYDYDTNPDLYGLDTWVSFNDGAPSNKENLNCSISTDLAVSPNIQCAPVDHPELITNYWCDSNFPTYMWYKLKPVKRTTCSEFSGFNVVPLCDFSTISWYGAPT